MVKATLYSKTLTVAILGFFVVSQNMALASPELNRYKKSLKDFVVTLKKVEDSKKRDFLEQYFQKSLDHLDKNLKNGKLSDEAREAGTQYREFLDEKHQELREVSNADLNDFAIDFAQSHEEGTTIGRVLIAVIFSPILLPVAAITTLLRFIAYAEI